MDHFNGVGSIARPPAPESPLATYNEAAALAIAGVSEVIRLGDMIAVVASNSWSAMEGRRALDARWSPGPYANVDNASLRNQLAEGLDGPPTYTVRHENDAMLHDTGALAFTYEIPLAQHAAIEPVNATAEWKDGHLTVWGPVQMATMTRNEIAVQEGLSQDQITVHTTLLGGSFGRKLERDYALQAAAIARRVEGPVQLVYSREDEMAHGGMRPPSLHRITFNVENNKPVGCHYRYAGLSVFAQEDPNQIRENGRDWTIGLGAADFPYAFPALRIEQTDVVSHAIPLNWWRGTWRNHHALATECAMDELAEAMGEDPLALRLSLLTERFEALTYPGEKTPVEVERIAAVLRKVAHMADYERARPAGRALGIACHSYSDVMSIAAHAVEVEVSGSQVKIIKVWGAIDCGLAVTPDSVVAQMEGAVAFGLAAVLWGDVEISEGAVKTLNFDSCRLLRADEMPPMEIAIMENDHPPGGVGEPVLPSFAPAFLNAIARAGGPRIRRLPANRLELIT